MGREVILWALVACALACTSAPPPRRTQVALPAGAEIDPAKVIVEPAHALRGLHLDAARRTLTIVSDRADLTVRVPGLCPLSLSGDVTAARARPLFDLVDTLAQVGFDAPIDVRVVPGCKEASAGRVAWRQREGLPLDALRPSERGFRLTARTLPLTRYFPLPLPPGVVAVSPRTQGRYVLEAVGHAAGHAPVRRTLVITSIARATGMASLAVSQRVMLGGEPLTVARAPRGAKAQVRADDGVRTFQPDAPGRYLLTGADGEKLELTALTHEHTPMDCARSECHAALSARAAASPMSFAFASARRAGKHGESAPGCAFECHGVGERGLDDGGFLAVARAFPFEPGATLAHMPHALQRLTSVRCTSCHGPSALPDAQGRERILRADVCATCHDAPPTYVHVERWRGSRMARADARVETRADACRSCHTTGGFLAALGVRKDGAAEPVATGIACAACHAPHGQSLARLVRDVPLPDTGVDAPDVARSASALCIACHAPKPDAPIPAASTAALWLGRVRLPEALGEPREIRSVSPHASVPGGCIGCHGAKEDGGFDHAFATEPSRCARCHTRPKGIDARLNERARELVASLRRSCGKPGVAADDAHPRHAQRDEAECGTRGPRARALYLALLVAEDGAVAIHNARFARALLSEAEALQKSGEP